MTFQACSTAQHRLKWVQAFLASVLSEAHPEPSQGRLLLLLTTPDPVTPPGETWAVLPPLSQGPCLGHHSHPFPRHHSPALLDLEDMALLSCFRFSSCSSLQAEGLRKQFLISEAGCPCNLSSQFFRMKLKVCSLKSDPSCCRSEFLRGKPIALGFWGSGREDLGLLRELS